MGYTKLFESILDSSIWCEDDATVRIWITMLAMKNRDGIVEAAVPGLAHRAHKTIEETKAALELFMSPDEYSRSAENDGRRIEVVPGGWRIINHDAYQERDSIEDKRANAAERQRKKRAREAALQGVTERDMSHESVTGCDVSQNVTLLDADADADADADGVVSVVVVSSQEAARDPATPDSGPLFTGADVEPEPMEPTTHELLAAEWMHAIGRAPAEIDRDLSDWADSLSKLERIDKRDPARVRAVVHYVMADKREGGGFPGWWSCCRSPAKLRRKSKDGEPYFDVIARQMDQDRTRGNGAIHTDRATWEGQKGKGIHSGYKPPVRS